MIQIHDLLFKNCCRQRCSSSRERGLGKEPDEENAVRSGIAIRKGNTDAPPVEKPRDAVPHPARVFSPCPILTIENKVWGQAFFNSYRKEVRTPQAKY